MTGGAELAAGASKAAATSADAYERFVTQARAAVAVAASVAADEQDRVPVAVASEPELAAPAAETAAASGRGG